MDMASLRRAGRVVPMFLLVLQASLVVSFLAIDRKPVQPWLITAGFAFALVGALILVRVPGNRVGWVCSLIGLAFVVSGNAAALGDRGFLVGDAVSGMMWLGWFVLAGLLILWYPTGRVPSPRWRVVEWAGYLAALVAASYLVAGDLCVSEANGSCLEFARNPIGLEIVPNPEYSRVGGVGFVLLLVFVLSSIVALVSRYRRAGDIERLQLKGLIFACLLLVTIVVVEEAVQGIPEWISNAVFGLGVLALPAAIGISILRFRLYGIERVISRTVGYGVVAAVVGSVYLVLSILIPAQFIGKRSSAFVAGATLVSAAIFNPVRRRVIRSIDRRFFRSRYDTELEISAFAGHLSERLDVASLSADWLGVVVRTMQPVSASVWVPAKGSRIAPIEKV